MAEPLKKIKSRNSADRVREIARSIAQRCIDTGQIPSMTVSDDDIDGLLDDERRFVLRSGLIGAVNDVLHKMRSSRSEESNEQARRTPMHAAGGRNPHFWRGLGIVLEGADQTLKELMRFDRSDLEELISESATMWRAWLSRKQWAQLALKALADNGVATIDQLPDRVKRDLDEKATEAWS